MGSFRRDKEDEEEGKLTNKNNKNTIIQPTNHYQR